MLYRKLPEFWVVVGLFVFCVVATMMLFTPVDAASASDDGSVTLTSRGSGAHIYYEVPYGFFDSARSSSGGLRLLSGSQTLGGQITFSWGDVTPSGTAQVTASATSSAFGKLSSIYTVPTSWSPAPGSVDASRANLLAAGGKGWDNGGNGLEYSFSQLAAYYGTQTLNSGSYRLWSQSY